MKLTDYITVVPPKRFRQFWTAKIGEIEATGTNREEATANLFADIKTICSGDDIPTMIFSHGYVALIWREREGWSYTIRRCGESGPVITNIHCIGAKEPTEDHARLHLAQFVLDDVKHPEEAAKVIKNEADRGDFIAHIHRDREVQRIMAERGADWHQASLIFDGLQE